MAEEMQEKQEKQERTARATVVELLSRVHPDCDFSDEDTIFVQVLNDYSSYADLINRQLEHEQEVADAFAAGEIAGRNAQIEATMLDDTHEGDGLPSLGGAICGANSTGTSIFDLASWA